MAKKRRSAAIAVASVPGKIFVVEDTSSGSSAAAVKVGKKLQAKKILPDSNCLN